MAKVLIKNGLVVSPTGVIANDVLIDGEKIAAVGAPGWFESSEQGCDKVIDAKGKYVIPGGVDVHTHMELPFGGTFASDTFETGSRAAAWGGVTTIVDMAVQRYGENVFDGLAEWHRKATGECAIDYAFHQIIGGVDDQSLKDMKYLTEHEGISSFKLFMAYPGVFYSDDGQILKAMKTAAECGAMIMMHAENGPAIDVLVQQALARGETDPRYHSYTRPSPLEAEATNRAIVLSHVAGNVPLYIVHMSAGDALNEVAAARHNGRNVFAETCPQYLWMTLEETLGQPGFEGSKWVCSTPVRSRDHDPHYIGQMGHGHQGDLWKGLRMNELAVVSTDHCPFCFKDQKELGLGDFSKIPNGIGGVEHRMELIYKGVVAGELTLERWVETCCTTPARMFGMYPQKGIIAPGSDADVVVWDPNTKTKIGINDKHHMNMDHSAWEGWVIDGKVDTVFSRGTVLIDNDQYVGRKGHGKYIKRGLSQYLVLNPQTKHLRSYPCTASIIGSTDTPSLVRQDEMETFSIQQPGRYKALLLLLMSLKLTRQSQTPRQRCPLGAQRTCRVEPKSCSTCASWCRQIVKRLRHCLPKSTAKLLPTHWANLPVVWRTLNTPVAYRIF